MCGIAGIVDLAGGPVHADEGRSMCAAIVHRGPDGEGTYLGQGVGLGMRRLSIIDLHTGDQPVRNEDGSAWVVFNGEIYNYRELRAQLEARGHRFYTHTDTEVIVHLYEERGVACVEALRGMFAFAVWDERSRQLLLARDRLGIKPLYYGRLGDRLVFGSELKALLALPEVGRSVDWKAFGHFLAFLSTPADQSILQGIRKLPPAHVLVARAGAEPRVTRYWDVSFAPDRGRSEAWYVDRLRELLDESVRLHLVSDVPLGAFLSGGIDSSAVVATMAAHTSEPVKTFTIGFADADFSELGHARKVAEAFQTEHHELVLEPASLDVLDDLVWHLDEPFGDSSAIPTYMVSRLAAQHVTVALSGDGGDELFAGYERYLVERRERTWRFVPQPLRRMMAQAMAAMPPGVRGRNYLRHVSLPGVERYLDAGTLFGRDEVARLVSPEVRELVAAHDPWEEPRRHLRQARGHWLSALQSLDLHSYLPLDILTKVDRMSMAHSLEARVPLLDHRLVEFAATVPPELQLRGSTTKYLLKRAMRSVLPASILHRPKQGFAIPLARWFGGGFEERLRDTLLSDTVRRRGVFDVAALEQRLRHGRADGGLGLDLWTLLSFELWCRAFLEGHGPALPAPADRAPWVVRRSPVPLSHQPPTPSLPT
jgi:asparagine synthase (glutamine-hydrolysing)